MSGFMGKIIEGIAFGMGFWLAKGMLGWLGHLFSTWGGGS